MTTLPEQKPKYALNGLLKLLLTALLIAVVIRLAPDREQAFCGHYRGDGQDSGKKPGAFAVTLLGQMTFTPLLRIR